MTATPHVFDKARALHRSDTKPGFFYQAVQLWSEAGMRVVTRNQIAYFKE